MICNHFSQHWQPSKIDSLFMYKIVKRKRWKMCHQSNTLRWISWGKFAFKCAEMEVEWGLSILSDCIAHEPYWSKFSCSLTHWGRVTHMCVSKLTISASDNGLSPGRRQAIIWIDAGILLIGPSGTNFNEMLIEILAFSFMKMRLKGSSAKWRPFCLGLNVLSMFRTWLEPEEFVNTITQ